MHDSGVVHVDHLELEHFRVYRDVALDVPAAGLRIVGPNGSGKTTILEAVELLSTTRPRQGATDGDLIAHDSGEDLGVSPYARVVGKITRGDIDVRLEVFVERSERRSATKKLFKVADRPRRAGDVVGLVPSVSFSPDDLDLVLGSPSGRRRFLDILLSQVDRRYLRHLSRYAKILAQRNGLLRQLGSGERRAEDELAYWDEQLVALGAYIVAARLSAMSGIRSFASQSFSELSSVSGSLVVMYASSVDVNERHGPPNPDIDVLDLAQRIGVTFEQQLRKGRQAELVRGATLVGPHRDDMVMTLDGRPLARFGSRGQQRLAVLSAKLAQARYAESILSVRPVLLLDDILSELDPANQRSLLAAVSGRGQLLVTATEIALVEDEHLSDLELVRLTTPGVLSIN